MKWDVEASPAYSILKATLNPGDSITADGGAFVAGFGDYEIKTHTGGVLKAFARAVAGGESMFLNTFTARSQSTLWFAPSLPGDIKNVSINGEMVVQDMSYLASSGDIDISVTWKGFRGLLAEGELVWLKLKGSGEAWINSYGAIEEINLNPGEKFILDNFHFVAMDSTIKFKIKKFGGWKSFVLGGEGIVAELEGPGRLLIQTRSLPPLAQLLARLIKK